MTVRVKPYRELGIIVPHCPANREHVVKTAGRLSVAAENKLGKPARVGVTDGAQNFLAGRLPAVVPQLIENPVRFGAQAEGALVCTEVCHIDIKRALV